MPLSVLQDLYFTPFEVQPGSTTATALSELVTRLSAPALSSSNNWGDLPNKDRERFLYNFNNFAHFLSSTSTDLDLGLRFATPEEEVLRELSSPLKVKEAAVKRDVVTVIEKHVREWCDQIQEVLTVRQQIRRERENIGPRSELVYWRRCLAKYTSIIEHLKSPVCQNCIVVLVLSKSKLLARWKRLDSEITEAANEAADTVKYMYGIQRLLAPLYQLDPPSLAAQIPNLMTLIRNLYSTSRFYNTTERLQVMLVKVTNQILNSCRAYLTCNDTKTIWCQAKRDVIHKMQVCIRLQRDYERRFEETREQVARCPLEGTFECSSMYIFGKFKKFCGRLLKIVYVLETTLLFSVLQSSCIEGIDEHAAKFIKMFQRISNQSFDPLNYRKEEFDVEFDVFKRSQVEAEESLYKFMRCSLQCCPDIHSQLMLIKRFEKLGLDCLEVQMAYEDALDKFMEEIESIRDRYNDNRQNLLVTRNLTPIAGRILWSRQFFERIAEPMNIYRETSAIQTEKAQKVIKHYNALAMTLVHYEIVHHTAWCNSTQLVRALLAESILRRDDDGTLCTNYNPYMQEVVRETECFWRMGLQVPEIAQVMAFCKKPLIDLLGSVTSLVRRYAEVRSTISRLFAPLMRAQLQDLEATIQPGLTTVMWTSLCANEFIKSVNTQLDHLEAFIKEVSDMKTARVDAALASLSDTVLVWLPAEPVAPKHFLAMNVEHVQKMSAEVALRSATAEGAVKELINRFADMIGDQFGDERYNWLDSDKAMRTVSSQTKLADMSREEALREVEKVQLTDISLFYNDCMDMFCYFNAKNIDALVKCNKNSLEMLRRRDGISMRSLQAEGEQIAPLFATDMLLVIPRMTITPTLEEANLIYNSVIANVMTVNKAVRVWGQEHSVDVDGSSQTQSSLTASEIETKTLYKIISEHREVTRTSNVMVNILLLLKPEIIRILDDHSSAHGIPLPEVTRQEGTMGPHRIIPLWDDARLPITQAFVDGQPLLADIRSRFECMKEAMEAIEALPSKFNVGCFQINFGPARSGLMVEAQAWKDILGRLLCQHHGIRLEENVKFIVDHTALLQRQIKDLDDVRLAMAALHEVAENFIRLDLSLMELEDMYALLTSYKVAVSREDIDSVNTLRYNFNNMVAVVRSFLSTADCAMKTQVELCAVQDPFRDELIRQVASFKHDVEKFDYDYEWSGPMVPDLPAREASDRVLILQGRLDELLARYEIYASGEELFGLTVNEYPTLMQKKRDFSLLQKLYQLYNQVMSTVEGYYDIVWAEVNIESIMEELAEFQNRCRRLPKGLREWPAYLDLKQMIDDFNGTCPLLEMMTNKAMKDRHWKRLEDLTNCSFDVESETFTLKTLLEAPLLQHIDDVTDICQGAVKEKDIEAKMNQVKADWAVVDLVFVEFKNRGELLLRGTEAAEIIAQLEDSLMVMSSLLSNRYNTYFKKEIQNLVWKLSTTSEIMEQWMVVQNLWVYLEAVFSGGDIAKELPAETKKFNGIDKSWVKIMSRARDVKNVLEVCVGDESMQQLLPFLLEQLESCQKSLSRYLEQKRLQFPRFFFVSDPALLEILGQASDSHTIQEHLLNVFENVAEVAFHEKEYDKILAIKSREGESITLDTPVVATGGVEVWLNKLLAMVRQSVNTVICNAVANAREPEYEDIPFIESIPAQVALLHIQMLWTQRAERALKEARLNRQAMPTTNQLFLDLLNLLIDQTTRDLSKFMRVLYETLITIHVHQRDIFDELCRLHIKSPLDFEWLKQARFYFDEEGEHINVCITDVTFIYQNEYLGNTDRLVITPLTDRCYITLAQAIGMHMGGAPAGPAGTGKTETTKDMGKALGKYVVVFNCSDQMDFRGLGRIFKGLAQSGSWGCFDEFNRIDLPVLSVAAQQIYIVLSARKQRQTHFLFSDGDNVSLNPEFGLFITMNPGYAGRQELPENLKIQFRSVAMMVPDRQIIIRVKLASCGFRENVLLARKFFTLYKLCEDQLSKQVHYDFGLRNILSCLRTLGAQKRANPQDSEETTVMRVLRDMNLSKLVDEDEPLFLTLIEDLFPGIKLATRSYRDLQVAISSAVEQVGLVNHPSWNLKLVQLYETSLVRHGLMIVGPTGAGKTQCIQTLMKAMTECGNPHKEMRMNPKAITAPQMFGRLDVATNDWTDGIFSTLWRKSLKVKKTETTWLVLDGPVDAVWIENLNSVLDDNKTLTLANGDRIVMAVNCKLLFEPDNLDNASPATVSRMGMVFMSSSCLPWNPILEGWLLRQHKDDAAALRPLFEALYDETQRFLLTRLHAKMHILEALYIRQCTDVLEGLMIRHNEARTAPPPGKEMDPIDAKHLERMLLFSIMWSLGAALELDDREKLEEFVCSHESKLNWPKPEPGESIFEYMVSTSGEWEHWSAHVEEFLYPDDSVPEYASILVPNVDNVRTAFLIDNCARHGKSVLLIGEQGTAKTVMIQGYVSKYDPEEHLSRGFSFSFATTPNMVQRTIESYLDKRVGTTYGPPNGRKMTLFVDDINMPVVNEWGDQVRAWQQSGPVV
ncbi:dynein axonemal heavy chain 5-like [Frankliniella occidentalis]|uniref:Dynein axonemal heavy chain 5-like n=1 Tax=Frankliniella occidentalis TaxID=133901 RepID=A0A9C6XQA0_FRAOC|nr:dynein axonemal heavy chain 5-like [Frankliniella occidentalis]